MRLAINLAFALPLVAARLWAADPWIEILGSVGLQSEQAAILIGDSKASREFGIRSNSDKIQVKRIVDSHRPQLEIYWDRPVMITRFEMPTDAKIFAWERWTNAPVLAGFVRDGRPVLWLASDPGQRGFERYPYLLQALLDLGLEPPARGNRLWAFFDSSYRLRADMDILARRWRKAGIAAIHVAAWHYYEHDDERDAWLSRLIETCHRHAILVYAWIELPHVSEKFWNDHPEWREKTALLGDAHLDWRKLMNLQNGDCAGEIESGMRALANRFDWDGINLGELYFESLEGYSNPARFTPFNNDVRQRFKTQYGFDPIDLFGTKSRDTAGMRKLLEFRATLAREMQQEWLGILSSIRAAKPGLDLVLTHIDDRFDTQIRDLLGADASQMLPLSDQHDFTFLVEDPATVWHLGPQRYPEIARRYQKLTQHQEHLAIDINIVERYQDVYPTKQQTGVELFQLVHLAAESFERVALYFENSILPPDLPLLAASSAVVSKVERRGDALIVDAPQDVLIAWKGPARVNGKQWPLYDGEFVRLPAGMHRIEPGDPGVQVTDVNAKVIAAEVTPEGVMLEYESRSRAIVLMNGNAKLLPSGRHRVHLTAATS